MNLGRAFGGLGQGLAQLTGKYIDEEILLQRQKALLDLRHADRVRGEEWEQSPEVQGRRRENERGAIQMRNSEALAAEVERQSSPALRQARIDNEVSFIQGVTPAKIEAENAYTEGTAGTKLDAERARRLVLDPMDVRKQNAIDDARERARAEREERTKTLFDKLPERVKIEVKQIGDELKDINAAVTKAQADGMWDPDKNKGQSDLQDKQLALRQRLRVVLRGSMDDGGGADPLGLFAGGPAVDPPPAKPDKPAKPERKPLVAERRAAGGPLEDASDDTLRRIAKIDGHANQAKALEILRRRRGEPRPGVSTAADALNIYP